MLEATGIPVDRALDYWGKGLSADETLMRLQTEGVNLSLGYDALKRQGVSVQELIERATSKNVNVEHMKEQSLQKARGRDSTVEGLGK